MENLLIVFIVFLLVCTLFVQIYFGFRSEPDPDFSLALNAVTDLPEEMRGVKLHFQLETIIPAEDTAYYIGYRSLKGAGAVKDSKQKKFYPNELYPLENNIFTLDYLSLEGEDPAIEIYIYDRNDQYISLTIYPMSDRIIGHSRFKQKTKKQSIFLSNTQKLN